VSISCLNTARSVGSIDYTGDATVDGINMDMEDEWINDTLFSCEREVDCQNLVITGRSIPLTAGEYETEEREIRSNDIELLDSDVDNFFSLDQSSIFTTGQEINWVTVTSVTEEGGEKKTTVPWWLQKQAGACSVSNESIADFADAIKNRLEITPRLNHSHSHSLSISGSLPVALTLSSSVPSPICRSRTTPRSPNLSRMKRQRGVAARE